MKTRTSAALLLALTFILGAVAGGVAHYLYQSHTPPPARRGGHPPGPREITDQLAQELKLDQSQSEKLKAIISGSREKYRALSQQFRPRYDAIRNETRQEIRAILRDDQKALFENFVREMDARERSRLNRERR